MRFWLGPGGSSRVRAACSRPSPSSRSRRSCGCSSALPETRSTRSTRAWRRACSRRTRTESPSGTSSRDARSRSRCLPPAGSTFTAARSAPWNLRARSTSRAPRTTRRPRATPTRSCGTRLRQATMRASSAPPGRPPPSTGGRCGSPTPWAPELGERLDNDEVRVYALTNIGNVERLKRGETENVELSLELALRAGLEEHAGRAFVATTWWSPRGRSYAEADRYFEPALEYCTERGLDHWRNFILAGRARAQLDRGHWDDAVARAAPVVRDRRTSPVPRATALAVLGLVRARRGDPDVWPALDEAWALASTTGELQRIEPPAAARAEALWLQGRAGEVAEATEPALSLALE